MSIDEISGNAVPPGALEEEVRDDQPIMASKGEYVIPADVVRYLGLEKIESLVNKAKEGLKEKAAQGRIGGKPMDAPPNREAPPVALSAPPVRPPMQAPPGMAEGGMVTPTISAPTMTKFTSPDGRTVYIPFVNGNPIIPIPQGYTPAGNETAPVAAAPQAAGPRKEQGYTKLDEMSVDNNPISEWSVDKFIELGQNLTNPVMQAATKVANSVIPGGNILSRLTNNYMDRTVPELLDNMIDTGVDSTGATLTQDQLEGLTNTREVMRDRISEDTGQRGNPFERVSDFVGRLFDGGQNETQPAPAAQAPASSGGSNFSDTSKYTVNSSNATAAPDKAASATTGSSKTTGPSPKPAAYGKGGLVTRRC